jgi:hypothetical protein
MDSGFCRNDILERWLFQSFRLTLEEPPKEGDGARQDERSQKDSTRPPVAPDEFHPGVPDWNPMFATIVPLLPGEPALAAA